MEKVVVGVDIYRCAQNSEWKPAMDLYKSGKRIDVKHHILAIEELSDEALHIYYRLLFLQLPFT